MMIDNCKEYRKLNPSTRKAVNDCITKLEDRYSYYKEQNIAITNLFGDGTIIHDIVDNDFYVYKSQSNRIQVRLLYKVDKNNDIDVVYFYIKNSNNLVNVKGKRQTRYLSLFEDYVKKYKKKEYKYNERSNKNCSVLCKSR